MQQKKEKLSLADKEIESYKNQKFCHICRKMLNGVDGSNIAMKAVMIAMMMVMIKN